MRRGLEDQGLHQRDTQDRARLDVVRQRLGGCRVDQRVEVEQMAKDFAGDRARKSLVGRREPARRQRVEALALAKDGVDHRQCGTARGQADRFFAHALASRAATPKCDR